MSGLIDALIGGLAGGAGYVAQDAARRTALEDRQAEKAADREAVMQDFMKRTQWADQYQRDNLAKNALAKAEADKIGFDAGKDMRDAQAQEGRDQAAANAKFQLEDPAMLALHKREIEDALRKIGAQQGPEYARLKQAQAQIDRQIANQEKATPLIAKLLQTTDPAERANTLAALNQYGVDGTRFLPGQKGEVKPIDVHIENPDPTSRTITPTVTRSVVRNADGSLSPVQIGGAGQQSPAGLVNSARGGSAAGGDAVAQLQDQARKEYQLLQANGMSQAEAQAAIIKKYPQLNKVKG